MMHFGCIGDILSSRNSNEGGFQAAIGGEAKEVLLYEQKSLHP